MKLLPATLIKEWILCPRLVYHKVDHGNLFPTKPQKEGQFYQEDEDLRFALAGHRGRIGLPPDPERKRRVFSAELGWVGEIDYAWISDKGFWIEELKTSPQKKGKPREDHLLQMAVYVACLKEELALPCLGAYLFYREEKKWHLINFESNWRNWIIRLKEIRQRIEGCLSSPILPTTNAPLSLCSQCECYNFCRDR